MAKDYDDEEISLDFSKIKDFFKKKPKKREHTHHTEDSVKEKPKSNDDEDISIDTAGLIEFAKKYGTVLLILIPIFLSIFLRLQPGFLVITDDWAESTVYNNIKNDIRNQINTQYSTLMPDPQKEKIINDEFNKLLNTPGTKDEIANMITGYSNGFRSQLQDDSGQTYLLAIDPYFWWKHSRNIVLHGHPGEELRNDTPYDAFMLAPNGRPVPPDMGHAYFMAYLYNFLKIFNPSLQLKNMIFYIPVLISALCVIPAFFIARKIGGNFGALVASILVAVHPAFLGRTAAGFADTDAYNVLFPLMITWFIIMTIDAKKVHTKSILAISAGLLTGLYAGFWGGWWYIFDFILVATAGYLIIYIILNLTSKKAHDILVDKNVKGTIITLSVYIMATAIIASMIIGPYAFFTNSFGSPISFMTIHHVGTESVWPNVFTTVAEQNEADFPTIIANIGGQLLFMIAIAGILIGFIRFKNKSALFIAILLVIWFIGSIYGSTKGIRFVLLLVPAFSLAVGIFFGVLSTRVTSWVKKELGLPPIVLKMVFIVIAFVLLFSQITGGYNTAIREIPSMNDAWYSALHEIDTNATEDAIINSWWDFGHWFKRIGNRPVTFDGTSQSTPQAHWIGLSLLTNDEQLSIGILRMLDCGGNKAFGALDEEINKTHQSIDILYEIVVEDKETANEILKKYVLSGTADEVLKLTHCQPPENYYITSQDMIGKSGVWAHFGSWDFKKATIFFIAKNMEQTEGIKYIMNEFGYSEDDARKTYFEIKSLDTERGANDWIAPWPSYASGLTGCRGEPILTCDNGLQVNLTSMQAFLTTAQGVVYPAKFSYIDENGDFIVKEETENAYPIGVSLIPSGSGYNAILTGVELTDSMFHRLFYFEGEDLAHFNKFNDKRSVFGERIITWKVDWDGTDGNDLYKNKDTSKVVDDIPKDSESNDLNITEEIIEEVINITNESEQNAT